MVPGATVTLTNAATGVSAVKTTSGDGAYEFFTVRAGTYVVTAEKSGFSVALVDNVQVQVGGRLRVDLQMTIGQIAARIEVSARAPLLETETSQRGQVITGEQTAALPLVAGEKGPTPGGGEAARRRSARFSPGTGASGVSLRR